MMWIHENTFAIGGLHDIGFAPATDLLLVLSSQGEGVFNCADGAKIVRRSNDYD